VVFNTKRCTLALLILLISGCTSAPKNHHASHIHSGAKIPEKTLFSVSPLISDHLLFRGAFESAVQEQDYSVMYMGGAGIAGIIAEIATHGMLESNSQNSKAKKAQDIANEALIPIQPAIEMLDSASALDNVIDSNPKLIHLSAKKKKPLLELRMQPMFFVDQSYSTLSLKNIVSVQERHQKNKPIYQNMVEIVSLLPEGLEKENTDGQLQHLQEITQQQLADSVSLALKDAMSILNKSDAMQTFRYAEYGKYSYERASLIEKSCSRVIIRTLRKWLKSRPVELFPDMKNSLEKKCSETNHETTKVETTVTKKTT